MKTHFSVWIAVAIMSFGSLATPAQAQVRWTGAHVNGGVGFGTWSANTTTANANTGACTLCVNQTQGGNGWLGKVGAGYDYQINQNWLAGVLFDYDKSELKGTIQDQFPFFAGNIKQESAYAGGVRVGWLFNPSTLVYVSGGYSRAYFSGTSVVTTFTGATSFFTTPAFNTGGGFIGVGMETNIARGWFLRGEFRYARYGSTDIPQVNSVTGARQANIRFDPEVQTGTMSVVYKF